MEERYGIDAMMTDNNSAGVQNFIYSFHALNNVLEINSILNDSIINFPYFNFRYLGNGSGTQSPFLNSSIGSKTVPVYPAE